MWFSVLHERYSLSNRRDREMGTKKKAGPLVIKPRDTGEVRPRPRRPSSRLQVLVLPR